MILGGGGGSSALSHHRQNLPNRVRNRIEHKRMRRDITTTIELAMLLHGGKGREGNGIQRDGRLRLEASSACRLWGGYGADDVHSSSWDCGLDQNLHKLHFCSMTPASPETHNQQPHTGCPARASFGMSKPVILVSRWHGCSRGRTRVCL